MKFLQFEVFPGKYISGIQEIESTPHTLSAKSFTTPRLSKSHQSYQLSTIVNKGKFLESCL